MVNPGFIRQLGNPGLGPRGSAALDPVHITAWTGVDWNQRPLLS